MHLFGVTHRFGDGKGRPAPTSVKSELVAKVLHALGLISIEVPGATPKKPFSGLMADTCPAYCVQYCVFLAVYISLPVFLVLLCPPW